MSSIRNLLGKSANKSCLVTATLHGIRQFFCAERVLIPFRPRSQHLHKAFSSIGSTFVRLGLPRPFPVYSQALSQREEHYCTNLMGKIFARTSVGFT